MCGLVMQQDNHIQQGQMQEQGKWSGCRGLIELLITYASPLNISQGLPHFMPILSADLLKVTKLAQSDSQKKDFQTLTPVLVAVCVSVFVCVLCPDTWLYLVEKCIKKNHFFLKAETFFLATQLSQMEMSWLMSYPSFIKPNSPSTSLWFCMASTCYFSRHMLLPRGAWM